MKLDWRENKLVIPVEEPYTIEQVKEIEHKDGSKTTETTLVERTRSKGDAVYEYVGNCTICNQRTFQRKTEVEADSEIGDRLAIHVGVHTDDQTGKKEPQILCAKDRTIKYDNGAEYYFVGACFHCGLMAFHASTNVRADNLLGDKLATYINSGKNMPPTVNCSHCYLRKNPEVAAQIAAGVRARNYQKTEIEKQLDIATAQLGGKLGTRNA